MKMNKVYEALDLTLSSNVTPALVGTSGVGKTSIAKQYGVSKGYDVVIVLRPSLIADVGDLIGLPDFEVVVSEINGNKIEERVTSFRRPDWLPNINQKALIVIDELNRAPKDIIMAMFDLIEADHPKIGKYVLPKGSKVIATLNPPTANYNVLDLKDSAFISRLCFLKIEPDFEVFAKWGKSTGKVSDFFIDFLRKNEKFSGSGEDFQVDMFDMNIADNNRSKEKVSELISKATELDTSDEVLGEVIRGMGGLEFSTEIMKFKLEYDQVVTLDDILVSKSKLNNFDYELMSNVSKVLEQLTSAIPTRKFTKDNYVNLEQFLSKIPLDTLQGFIMTLHEVTDIEDEEREKAIVSFFEDVYDVSENGEKGFVNRINEIKEVKKLKSQTQITENGAELSK